MARLLREFCKLFLTTGAGASYLGRLGSGLLLWTLSTATRLSGPELTLVRGGLRSDGGGCRGGGQAIRGLSAPLTPFSRSSAPESGSGSCGHGLGPRLRCDVTWLRWPEWGVTTIPRQWDAGATRGDTCLAGPSQDPRVWWPKVVCQALIRTCERWHGIMTLWPLITSWKLKHLSSNSFLS